MTRTRFFSVALFSFLFLSFTTEKSLERVRIFRHTAENPFTYSPGDTDNPYYIIVYKHSYELKVFDSQGWYATYPCVFGSSDMRDKYMEGDKRTPEGKFKVIEKKINPDWGYELLLDYPNSSSYEKFNERKAEGLIPRNAKIGGGIAIHATRPQEEWTVDYYQNWTDGCISLKYSEAKDLYSYIPVGTPVTIVE